MRRAPLYSASKRPGRDAASDAVVATAPAAAAPDPDRLLAAAAPLPAAAQSAPTATLRAGDASTAVPAAASASPPMPARRRWRQPLAALAVCALVGAGTAYTLHRIPRALTQDDIDRAVKHALQNQVLPSPSARAYEKIGPSVVRVVGYSNEKDDPKDKDAARDVGSGVVVVDRGVILTSLHVVAEAKRVKVVFADGLEADAEVIGAQPENDLAVLQAKKIPDDLTAATLRSTGDLKPGDHVTAVGFPFGIGPSVSAGVVSGLKRDFRAPDGERTLSNLIQFDAAANPGSSGGPLVTDEGEVVGIVTAILNPVQQRFFVGIGFAVPIEAAAAGAGMPPF